MNASHEKVLTCMVQKHACLSVWVTTWGMKQAWGRSSLSVCEVIYLHTHIHNTHTLKGPFLPDSPFIQSWLTREMPVTTEIGSMATRALWDSSVLQHIDNLPLLIDGSVDLFLLSLSFGWNHSFWLINNWYILNYDYILTYWCWPWSLLEWKEVIKLS